MKRLNQLQFVAAFAALFSLTMACNQNASDETLDAKPDSSQITTTTEDPAKLKEEIQALETAWAKADNAGDVKTVAAFYADDAVSLGPNKPMIVGRAAIEKDVEANIGKRKKGVTIAYDVLDAFGGNNYVTEIGKITRKDSTGKTISTGKYMAVWEKRDGKWMCIRDIVNDDAKEE